MLLHASTSESIQHFLADPSHALLISGPEGSGKGSIAQHVASQLLRIEPEALAQHPYTFWLTEQPVTIESIRSAQKLMQLKVPGSNTIRRIVIVEQAQSMSIEAQNAFLKLLEEPPADTVIILTVSSAKRLLPTIRSRTQHITVQPPSKEVALAHFTDSHSTTAIEKAYHLSEGYVGLMKALLEGDDNHPLVAAINQAKAVLAGTPFDRLCQVDVIAKDKQVPVFLKALERICHAALMQSAAKQSPATKAWKARLQAVVEAEDLQKHNPSTKLLLTNLFLHI